MNILRAQTFEEMLLPTSHHGYINAQIEYFGILPSSKNRCVTFICKKIGEQ
jgi:hypothetical protein